MAAAGGSRVVTASQYGGSDGDHIGSTEFGYAELSNNPSAGAGGDFSALGNLPRGTLLAITYNGKTVIAPKVDVGAGGAGLNGHARAIDLTASLAKALGFSGLGNVTVSRVPSGTSATKTASLSPTPAATSSPTSTSTGGGATQSSIAGDLKYALIFGGLVAMGAIVLGIGVSRSGHSTPVRAARARHAAIVAR